MAIIYPIAMTLQSLFEDLERSVLTGDPGRVIAAADKGAEKEEERERRAREKER